MWVAKEGPTPAVVRLTACQIQVCLSSLVRKTAAKAYEEGSSCV
jgi:hypothetical protein